MIATKPRSQSGNNGSITSTETEQPSVVQPTTSVAGPNVNYLSRFEHIFVEYALMAEYMQFCKQKLSNVFVMPSYGSPLKWFGVVFIREGVYAGGAFRFTLYVHQTFPDGELPMVIFDANVYHPHVSLETGEFDVGHFFDGGAAWKRNRYYLWHVIKLARDIFSDDFLASNASKKSRFSDYNNPDAARLYAEDRGTFEIRASHSVATCLAHTQERPSTEDPHAFDFRETSAADQLSMSSGGKEFLELSMEDPMSLSLTSLPSLSSPVIDRSLEDSSVTSPRKIPGASAGGLSWVDEQGKIMGRPAAASP